MFNLAKENFTAYEWDIELVDKEYGDILDHDHSDKCPGIPTLETEVVFERLVLVKDVYRQWDLSDRSWAYVEDGKLPEYFDGDSRSKVPKRFHAELRKL